MSIQSQQASPDVELLKQTEARIAAARASIRSQQKADLICLMAASIAGSSSGSFGHDPDRIARHSIEVAVEISTLVEERMKSHLYPVGPAGDADTPTPPAAADDPREYFGG